jgi:hypothetical protein
MQLSNVEKFKSHISLAALNKHPGTACDISCHLRHRTLNRSGTQPTTTTSSSVPPHISGRARYRYLFLLSNYLQAYHVGKQRKERAKRSESFLVEFLGGRFRTSRLQNADPDRARINSTSLPRFEACDSFPPQTATSRQRSPCAGDGIRAPPMDSANYFCVRRSVSEVTLKPFKPADGVIRGARGSAGTF